MGVSNGIISAPVSIADVQSVLGGNNDLGTLCQRSNINMWSRIRPCRCKINAANKYAMLMNQGTASDGGASINDNADVFGADAGSGNYSVSSSYLTSPNGLKLPAVTASNIANNLKLQYPAPDYYRLTDFNGYCHSAPIPIIASIAKQGIININDSNLNFTILQFDTQNITDKYRSVEIKRLFNSGGLGEYYLGFAFVRASSSSTCFRVSTGKKLKDLFNNNVSGNLNETASNGVAQSYILGQGGIVYFGFNFRNVVSMIFSGVTVTGSWYVRPVVLTSGTFITTQGGFSSSVGDCYSLELYQGFGVVTRSVTSTYNNPFKIVVSWQNLSYSWSYISSFQPVNSNSKTERVVINGETYLKYKISSRPYGNVAALTVNAKVSSIRMINTETGQTVKTYSSYGGTIEFTALRIANSSNYRTRMYFGNDNYANNSTLTQTQINTMKFVSDLQSLKDLFSSSDFTNASGTVSVGSSVSKSGTARFSYDYVYIYYADRSQGTLRIDIEDAVSGAVNSIINGAGTY